MKGVAPRREHEPSDEHRKGGRGRLCRSGHRPRSAGAGHIHNDPAVGLQAGDAGGAGHRIRAGAGGGGGLAFSHALGADARRLHLAGGHQVVLDGFGAAGGQRLVVGVRSHAVGVALDADRLVAGRLDLATEAVQRGPAKYAYISQKWEFPGGKLEDGESEIDCIKREIKEEINIEIDIINQLTNSLYDYGTFKINLIPFTANYISGNIILSEHKDYKLLEKNELLSLDWAEADLPIVEELLKLEL